MYKLIAAFGAPVLLVALLLQTARVDGVPFFYTGLAEQLADCKLDALSAEVAALSAADKARKEGRASAAEDSKALVEAETQRRVNADKDVAALRALIARLKQTPPQPAPRAQPSPEAKGGVPMPPPAAPPMAGLACVLEQRTLDALRSTLNQGRGQP